MEGDHLGDGFEGVGLERFGLFGLADAGFEIEVWGGGLKEEIRRRSATLSRVRGRQEMEGVRKRDERSVCE